MTHSASPSSARKVAPQRPTSRMGEPWSAPGASSTGAASARVRHLDDAWWRASRARPMVETSTTAHDNEFAAAVALQDLEEAKHDPFEWLRSPIKLTPLETSRRLAGTTYAEQKNTRDFDYIEQRDNFDGRRGKYIHSSRKQGGTAEASRKPAYNPGASNDSFPRRTVEESEFCGGSFARELPSSSVESHLTTDTAVARLPRSWNSIPEGSIIGRTKIGGGRPTPWKGKSTHYTAGGRGTGYSSSGRPRGEDTSSPGFEGSDVEDVSFPAIPESLLKNRGFRESASWQLLHSMQKLYRPHSIAPAPPPPTDSQHTHRRTS